MRVGFPEWTSPVLGQEGKTDVRWHTFGSTLTPDGRRMKTPRENARRNRKEEWGSEHSSEREVLGSREQLQLSWYFHLGTTHAGPSTRLGISVQDMTERTLHCVWGRPSGIIKKRTERPHWASITRDKHKLHQKDRIYSCKQWYKCFKCCVLLPITQRYKCNRPFGHLHVLFTEM